MAENSGAVTVSHPPLAVLHIINPIIRSMLHTPLLGSARKQMMVLTFTGRKTHRRYTLPVSAHHVENDLYALTGARWRLNFRGGADVDVFYDGATSTQRGELIEDETIVADLYHRCAESYGSKTAQRSLGLKFRDAGIPTNEEFAEVVEHDHLGAIKLTPA